MDYRKCPERTPFVFRCRLELGTRGPYSTGRTTVLRKNGTLVVKLTTKETGNVFVGDGPLRYGVEIRGDVPVPAGVGATLIDWQGRRQAVALQDGQIIARWIAGILPAQGVCSRMGEAADRWGSFGGPPAPGMIASG